MGICAPARPVYEGAEYIYQYEKSYAEPGVNYQVDIPTLPPTKPGEAGFGDIEEHRRMSTTQQPAESLFMKQKGGLDKQYGDYARTRSKRQERKQAQQLILDINGVPLWKQDPFV